MLVIFLLCVFFLLMRCIFRILHSMASSSSFVVNSKKKSRRTLYRWMKELQDDDNDFESDDNSDVSDDCFENHFIEANI